ncbi:MAG: MarR family transcriptional regulator [Parcubacteria group bacterium]|nr:MarR family transcriptional regulator [Parcubacteria group bacterium]
MGPIQEHKYFAIVQLVMKGKRDLPDLTHRQLAIMVVLVSATTDRERTVRYICQYLGLQKPVVSRAHKALQTHGLLELRPDPGDRRSVLLFVTEKGREYF